MWIVSSLGNERGDFPLFASSRFNLLWHIVTRVYTKLGTRVIARRNARTGTRGAFPEGNERKEKEKQMIRSVKMSCVHRHRVVDGYIAIVSDSRSMRR